MDNNLIPPPSNHFGGVLLTVVLAGISGISGIHVLQSADIILRLIAELVAICAGICSIAVAIKTYRHK